MSSEMRHYWSELGIATLVVVFICALYRFAPPAMWLALRIAGLEQ